MSLTAPALITAEHRVEPFDCGQEALNQYLKRYAHTNTAAGRARTYVATNAPDLAVAGYYSLAAGSVERATLADRIAKGVPNHPIPVVLLARLAVDQHFQKRGVGKGLVKDALQRVRAAGELIGIRALLVHAKDQEAAAFYKKFCFVPSPTDPLHLMLLMKDLKHTLRST